MHSIMYGTIDDLVLVYLDDLLVFSDNENEHETYLYKVFDRLCAHQL